APVEHNILFFVFILTFCLCAFLSPGRLICETICGKEQATLCLSLARDKHAPIPAAFCTELHELCMYGEEELDAIVTFNACFLRETGMLSYPLSQARELQHVQLSRELDVLIAMHSQKRTELYIRICMSAFACHSINNVFTAAAAPFSPGSRGNLARGRSVFNSRGS
ncbi:hypothetical protein M9458_050703, partial [Cirrhinus mrigala]